MSGKQTASLVVIISMIVSSAHTQEPSGEKLPEPLTLEYALSLADEPHPDLQAQDARIQSLMADRQAVDDADDYNIYLDIGAQETNQVRIQPSRSDHVRAGVVASSTLYDFGRTDSKVQSIEQELASEKLNFLDLRTQRRLQILDAFFAVLLADLQFSWYNEWMAIAYIDMDRAQDRRELGTKTDLEVLELEAEFQRVRALRYESENLQRETRAILAVLLNRPDNLPATLAMPKLDNLDRELADVSDYTEQAIANNYRLNALRARVRAAENAVVAARSEDNAVLKGRIEAYQYDTPLGSSDEVFAGVAIEIPLLNSSTESRVAGQRARLYSARARLQQYEAQIRQTILRLWHEIEVLQIRRLQAKKYNEYRELDLEKRRALYEMEVKADLGDGMVNLTEAQYRQAKADYEMALALYKLDILVGKMKLDELQSFPTSTQTPQE